MLKLLTCAQGHYWEKPVEDGTDDSREICPTCGQIAETMPLLDLASSETAPPPEKPPAPPPLRDKDGRPIVAGYEILQDLGQGPTGVLLYRARQLLVNRLVTLKVVFAGNDPGQLAWGSLRNEAGALGRMAHPNIVQILEAGERDRQLFYNAIEHVDGPTLAETLDGKPLPICRAVTLVETLARAIHHAHEKNLLHRNLKPASILLQKDEGGRMKDEKKTEDNSSSSFRLHPSSFVPKITDFGLARRPAEGDTADVELQGERPYYVAPEQAWGRAKEIGAATDVYALGAILYELLTGQPPFREESATETLDAIQCREARPPSRLRRGLSRNLDAICRKCLAKQSRRRYASALELADDLRRFADGYPIKARAAGNIERFGKWLHRHFRTIALIVLSLWAGVSLLALFAYRDSVPSTESQREATNYQRLTALVEGELTKACKREADANYLRYLALADRALREGERDRVIELLNHCPIESRRWEWHYLLDRSQGIDVATDFKAELPIAAVDLSRGGRYLAAGGGTEQPPGIEGEISIWDLITGQRVQHWHTKTPVRGVAFSMDGNRLAAVGSDELKAASELQLFDVTTGVLLASRRYRGRHLNSVAYSPDQSQLLAAGGDGCVFVLPANDLRDMLPQQVPFDRPWRFGENHAHLLPLPPDAGRFAIVSPDGGQVAIVADPRQGDARSLRGLDTTVLALAYDAPHQMLATAGRDRLVSLWRLGYPADFPIQSIAVLRGHRDTVTGVSFSSDGERLASCGEDGTVRVWDPTQKVELLTLRSFTGVRGVLFGPGRDEGIMALDARIAPKRKRMGNRLVIAHGNKVTLLEP